MAKKKEFKLLMPRPPSPLVKVTSDEELLGYQMIVRAPNKSWRGHVYGGAKK